MTYMKKIKYYFALYAAKASQSLLKLLGRNATYFPGKVAIRLCKDFLSYIKPPKTVIAVTGTNGKTTITYLIKHILESAGKKVGLIGTIQNLIGDISLPAKYTTPDAAELHVIFSRMANAGCEYVVMEVSSQALDQKRVEGCHFETAVFTNLTQDHLDYHGTMENYFDAKKELFRNCEKAVVCIDDEYGKRLCSELSVPVSTVSIGDISADYTAHDVKNYSDGCKFAMVGTGNIGRVSFSMPGKFSASNAMLAAAAAMNCGLSFEEAVEGLNTCPGVKGRVEVIHKGDFVNYQCGGTHILDGIGNGCPQCHIHIS